MDFVEFGNLVAFKVLVCFGFFTLVKTLMLEMLLDFMVRRSGIVFICCPVDFGGW